MKSAKVDDSKPAARDLVHSIQEQDILLGRGVRVNSRPANVEFRKLCQEQTARYIACDTYDGKDEIVAEIEAAVESSGGRFLRPVIGQSGTYEIADKGRVRAKIKQAIRDQKALLLEAAQAQTVEQKMASCQQRLSRSSLLNSPAKPRAASLFGVSSLESGNIDGLYPASSSLSGRPLATPDVLRLILEQQAKSAASLETSLSPVRGLSLPNTAASTTGSFAAAVPGREVSNDVASNLPNLGWRDLEDRSSISMAGLLSNPLVLQQSGRTHTATNLANQRRLVSSLPSFHLPDPQGLSLLSASTGVPAPVTGLGGPPVSLVAASVTSPPSNTSSLSSLPTAVIENELLRRLGQQPGPLDAGTLLLQSLSASAVTEGPGTASDSGVPTRSIPDADPSGSDTHLGVVDRQEEV